MNSYSTQVAQLQFEYKYELDKICLDKQDIIDEAFMPYQSMNETWNNSCELHHTSVK
jgi:hypothetical protein